MGEYHHPNLNINLPAVEFIKCGYASGAAVLALQDEVRTPATGTIGNGCNDTTGSDSKRVQAIENATRLALLLTRSFANTYMENRSPTTARNPSPSTPLELKDFYINFDLNSTFRSGSIITLRGVGIISQSATKHNIEGVDQEKSPQEDEPSPNAKTQHIVILGKILYSIFCHGQSLPLPILETISSQSQEASRVRSEDYDGNNNNSTEPTTSGNDHNFLDLFEIDNERSTRRLRITEKTVFMTLIENNNTATAASSDYCSLTATATTNTLLPKSICRLIADMIDAKSVSSFASFEDVLFDLEQMISQPWVFLHDSKCCFRATTSSATTLQFGQKYHGREKEVSTLMKLAIQIMDPKCQLIGVQVAFISGIAGSGKSRLVQSVADNLSSLSGWIVVKAKFERVHGQRSPRSILSSMFNDILSYLVTLKESHNPVDVAYSQRVSKRIMESIGTDTLSELVDFLPILLLLFEGIIGEDGNNHANKKDITNWQLSIALSAIIGAILNSGRYIMICCDDLQWADAASFSLISDVLVKVGYSTDIGHCCLFMGIYRSDEIGYERLLSVLFPCLQTSSSVNITERIELSNLSKDDLQGMLMVELQLPRRLVSELAEVVHKKTTGHAFFVVELLNSLLRDSIVTYCSDNCRYSWDEHRIVIIETGKNVAEFIASNLKSIEPESLQVLQILSCFGIQTDFSLLQILEKYHGGILCSIDNFIEKGILDQAGPLVIFSHDLIHETVYGSMTLHEGKLLHMRIGQFLGLELDAPLAIESVTKNFGQLHLKDQTINSGRNMTSTLVSLTCDQVNAAGSDYIRDHSQRESCAKWNLSAGQSFAGQSDFSAALYYYTNGVTFLGQDSWSNDHLLCLELHQGAVLSSFALGNAADVDRYAQKVIDNVAFEDTLDVQVVVLKSLSLLEKHKECTSRGIDLLRQLNFELPLAPSREIIGHAMASVAKLTSRYPSDHIANLCQDKGSKDDSKYTAIRVADAVLTPAYTTHSPFLPLIACEVVKFSFQNGCCLEAAASFAIFSRFKTFMGDEYDFTAGKHWADLARTIINCSPKKDPSSEIRTNLVLLLTIDNFFEHPRDVASKLIHLYHDARKIGQIDSALICLTHAWRFRLFGGHNLRLICKAYEDNLEFTAKNNIYCAKYMLLDAFLVMQLTGKTIDCSSVCSSVFGSPVASLDDIGSESESFKDNRFVGNFHLCKMLICYWNGNLVEAGKELQLSYACPSLKMPRFSLIYHTFFGGLVLLALHRQMGGSNDQILKQGRDAMKEMESWVNVSMALFDNKWLLLQAEYSACIGDHDRAQMMYLASINAAKDHGYTHELALAYELWGNYCLANDNKYSNCASSSESFRQACVYYEQWGATTLAEKLMRRHNLRMHPGARKAELLEGKSKQARRRD